MKLFPLHIRIFRHIIVVAMIMLAFNTFAQFDCTIMCTMKGDTVVFENDTILCYKQDIYLFTQFADTMNYSWEPGGQTGVIIEEQVRDTTTYILTTYNDDSTYMCKDSIKIFTYPKIEVTFEQISKGCPGECKAQVKATADNGFPPYSYYWSAVVAPNDSSLALGLCTESNASLQVRDTICVYDTAFLVEGYDMPEIEVTMSPDSLFSTNPQAQFSFDNKSNDSIPLSNWTWIFPDSSSTNLMNPKYVFTENDSVLFTYQTIDGCIDTITINVSVQEFELTLYNVFTPNGDGINDTYEIPNLDRYISNQFIVFNRWGERVFEAKNYHNEWDGGNLPDGVYYYILKAQGYWEESIFHGSVSIYGSGN